MVLVPAGVKKGSGLRSLGTSIKVSIVLWVPPACAYLFNVAMVSYSVVSPF